METSGGSCIKNNFFHNNVTLYLVSHYFEPSHTVLLSIGCRVKLPWTHIVTETSAGFNLASIYSRKVQFSFAIGTAPMGTVPEI